MTIMRNQTNGQGCCSDKCRNSDDCSAGLFCCPNHFECMDTTTKSTAGPKCDACQPSAPKQEAEKACGDIKAGKYLHLPSKEVNPNGACSAGSCSGVDCGIALATCAGIRRAHTILSHANAIAQCRMPLPLYSPPCRCLSYCGAVSCATSFPAGCLSCLGSYPGCCRCASYELGFDCGYC